MAILTVRDNKGNEYEIPAIKGEKGKSAYDYAKEGGYTGTEEEFAVLLSKKDEFTSDKVNELLLERSKKEHEVGSLYLSMTDTNPFEIFGFGTWELIAKDRFLVGAGGAYKAGDTGGESTHTLIAAELPKQTGTIVTHGTYSGTPIADASGVFTKQHIVEGKYLSGSQGTSTNSIDVIGYNNGGQGQAHNNMPPYIAVYMWRRTA